MSDLPLYYAATPPPYAVKAPRQRGLVVSAEGAGTTDQIVTGIVPDIAQAFCGTPQFIGRLDTYAGQVNPASLVQAEVDVAFVREGQLVQEESIVTRGMAPLKTLLVSGPVGRDIPGGKTVYGVEVATNCQDVIFVGLASKQRPKEDFIFRKWIRVLYPNFIGRPVVSGREFKVFIATLGAGRFNITGITLWMKVTDRRGFNTSPQAVKGGPQ